MIEIAETNIGPVPLVGVTVCGYGPTAQQTITIYPAGWFWRWPSVSLFGVY